MEEYRKGKVGRRPELKVGRRPELKVGRRPELKVGRRPELKVGRRPELKVGRRPELKVGRRHYCNVLCFCCSNMATSFTCNKLKCTALQKSLKYLKL